MRQIRWQIIGIAVGFSILMLAGTAAAKSSVPAGPAAEDDFEGATDPLPPGIKERVFIHLPRTHQADQLGTCTETTNAGANDYGLAGWQLPADGIIWYVNLETVPSMVDVSAAVDALQAAFGAWTDADHRKNFVFGGSTDARRPRFDYVNSVLWRKLSRGVIGITYVRYYTATGVIADVDTVFNSRYPWAIFDPLAGECQSSPDAYDIQNIATHEFGHWVGLEDLYVSTDRDLTMYGYGAGGELKKRTLGVGDISGAGTAAP